MSILFKYFFLFRFAAEEKNLTRATKNQLAAVVLLVHPMVSTQKVNLKVSVKNTGGKYSREQFPLRLYMLSKKHATGILSDAADHSKDIATVIVIANVIQDSLMVTDPQSIDISIDQPSRLNQDARDNVD